MMILGPTVKSVCRQYESDRRNVQEDPCECLSGTERIAVSESMASTDEPSIECVRERGCSCEPEYPSQDQAVQGVSAYADSKEWDTGVE